MEHSVNPFVHPKLNDVVTAIGGKYVLVREDRIRFQDEDLLVIVGVAVFDSTCCGAGGCYYALVPGFVRKWKYRTDDEGNSISLIAPVPDGFLREKIASLILEKESVYQVDFL